MGNFTKNISNTVRILGEGPSTKWGQVSFPATMVWGTAKWGEGRAMQFQVSKVVVNSQPATWAPTSKQVGKNFEIGSAPIASDMGSEKLLNGEWFYVFPSLVTDGESRFFPSFTSDAAQSVSYTCLAAGATTWVES